MTGLALLLAASAMGVDYGWRPHEEGGVEYIIQIEPEVLASLQAGGDIVSEIHPDAHNVRRFRIRIGRGVLPREGAETTAADDGPLPPAPPGDDKPNTETSPSTSITSRSRSASPPLNHLAQGSGYGSPFGGYSGSYGRAGSYTASEGASTGSTASNPSTTSSTSGTGTYGSQSPASSTYNSASTTGASSRTGYSEYNSGSSRAGSSGASTFESQPASSSAATTASDTAWSRGDVRTASNQPAVSSTSTSAAPSSGTAAGQGYSSQPSSSATAGQAYGAQPASPAASSQTYSGQAASAAAASQPSSTVGGSGTTQGQTPNSATSRQGYTNSAAGATYANDAAARSTDSSVTPVGGYRSSRENYPASTQTTDGAGYNRGGQYGSLTPVSSGYDDSRPAGATSQPAGYSQGSQYTQGNQGQTEQSSGWNAVARQQDRGAEPPPAYPARTAASESPASGVAPPPNNGYANPGYNPAYANGQYGNPYPNGAAPPLLAPAAAAGNYGYTPAGYPPYQLAAQPGAYPYAQTPGVYAMPPLAAPTLVAAGTSESGAKSRRQAEEDDEEPLPRRTAAAQPAPVIPAAQPNIVTSEPWLAFTITIVLLFASVGGNIYLLWISQDFYWRYKELANDLRNFNTAAS